MEKVDNSQRFFQIQVTASPGFHFKRACALKHCEIYDGDFRMDQADTLRRVGLLRAL